MTELLDGLRADLEALGATVRGALPAQAGAEAVAEVGTAALVDRQIERMSGAGVVRVLEVGARLRRRLDAFLVRVAAEAASRSAPEFGAEGLAKQHGHQNATRLVSAALGGSTGEAARVLAVGAATRSRSSFTGESLLPKHAHARTGLDSGALSVEAAAAITNMLDRVERRADPAMLEPVEATLVQLAADAPLSLVGRALKHAEARLDPDGVEPADDTLLQERYLSLHEEPNGMFRLRGLLDPVTAAPLKTALDALVGDALRRRGSAPCAEAAAQGEGEGAGAGAGGPSLHEASGRAVVEDRRSIPQILADSLSEIAHHALGCGGAPAPLAKTTVVVRMSLDALTRPLGTAEIDGVDRPISAASARLLAVDAEVIPAVFGGDSVPLDLGRAVRLFTRAQRIALAERDGGCASCGQNITYAHAHHIEWWTRDAGPTDLENGVMLCGFCHRQVHREGWGIRADRSSVWFIPPPHVDPTQRPRLGGRARFDLVARHVA